MSLDSSSRTFLILFVAEDPAEADLTVRLFQQAAPRTTLQIAGNGAEALAYLRREEPHAAAPRPDLILLDLSRPIASGVSLLSAIKGDADLRRIPVVVLSRSGAIDDIQSVYEQRANCYLTKPSSLREFEEMVATIESFWFSVAQLPSEG